MRSLIAQVMSLFAMLVPAGATGVGASRWTRRCGGTGGTQAQDRSRCWRTGRKGQDADMMLNRSAARYSEAPRGLDAVRQLKSNDADNTFTPPCRPCVGPSSHGTLPSTLHPAKLA